MARPLDSALDLVCVGLNHETTPIEIRDALVMNAEEIGKAIRALRERAGAEESLVLSTCNRTEVYARGAATADPLAFVAELIREIKGHDLPSQRHLLYTYREPESIRHLLRVASGLNSMVLGEPQIVGQVKDAHALAAQAGGSGPVTERLLDTALRCAKRARTETGIGRGPVSSAYAAVNLAAKVLGPLGGMRVLVIGSGEMAGLATCHFLDAGAAMFTIASRTRERAETLAAKIGARVVSPEAIPVVLPGADIVVSATTASGFTVTESAVRAAMRIRKNRPLLLLDLAVPRDIDPEAARLPNVFLHDLDALGAIVAQSLEQRRAEVPRVEAIVEEELGRFLRWYRSLELKPTVTAFREHFERVAREELARHHGRFRPEDLPAAESLAHGIVQKLLHRPTTRLHRAGEDGPAGLRRIDAARELFGLDGTDDGEGPDAGRNPR